jgi:hypothetical protein
MFRELNETEMDCYGKVRVRHPELNLPTVNDGAVRVSYGRGGPVTLATVEINGQARLGWSACSRLDLETNGFNPEIGQRNAFSRALRTPVEF